MLAQSSVQMCCSYDSPEELFTGQKEDLEVRQLTTYFENRKLRLNDHVVIIVAELQSCSVHLSLVLARTNDRVAVE
jgi:hypothetical protein